MGIFHPVLSIHHTPSPIVTVTNQGDADPLYTPHYHRRADPSAPPRSLPIASYTAPPHTTPASAMSGAIREGIFQHLPDPSDRHKNNPH